MKNIIKIILVLSLLIINAQFLILKAQVAINSDGTSPDESAMLEITSSEKGILIPRFNKNLKNWGLTQN